MKKVREGVHTEFLYEQKQIGRLDGKVFRKFAPKKDSLRRNRKRFNKKTYQRNSLRRNRKRFIKKTYQRDS